MWKEIKEKIFGSWNRLKYRYANSRWFRVGLKLCTGILPLVLGLFLKLAFFQTFDIRIFLIWSAILIILWLPLQALSSFLSESKTVNDKDITIISLEQEVKRVSRISDNFRKASDKQQRIVHNMDKQLMERIKQVDDALYKNLIDDRPKLEMVFDFPGIIKTFIGYIWAYFEEGRFEDEAIYRVSLMEPINEYQLSIIEWANKGKCTPYSKVKEIEGIKFEKRQGCCGYAWAWNRLIIIQNVEKEISPEVENPRFHIMTDAHRKLSIQSMFSLPISDDVLNKDGVYAVLNVDCNIKNRFQESIEGIEGIKNEMGIFAHYLTLMYKYKRFVESKLCFKDESKKEDENYIR